MAREEEITILMVDPEIVVQLTRAGMNDLGIVVVVPEETAEVIGIDMMIVEAMTETTATATLIETTTLTETETTVVTGSVGITHSRIDVIHTAGESSQFHVYI